MLLAEDLKKSILQAAMQGKLTKQLPSDSSVDSFIIKNNIEVISEEVYPFEIPESWKFVKLEYLTAIPVKRGKTPKYVDKSSTLVFAQKCNKKEGYISLEEAKYLDEKLKNKYGEDNYLKGNDIVINSTGGGTLGRIGYISTELIEGSLQIVPDTHITTIRVINDIHPKYIFFYLKNNQSYLESKGVGSTNQTELRPDIIKNLLVPLPPIEEQQRIVYKLNEVLKEVAEYAETENELDEIQKTFPENMRKAILQAALQGKLTKQLLTDGSVGKTLQDLKEHKEKLVQEGKVYKKKATEPFYTQDYPFNIPDNWKWVQLSDVSIIQEGAGIRKHQYTLSGTQLFSVTNILNGSIDLEKKRLYVSTDEYKEKYQRLTLNKGDIVTACSGGSWGKVAIYDKEDTVMLNTSTLRLRFFDDLADNKYLYYVVQSFLFKNQLAKQLVGIQPNFGYAHYSRICFPLPPIEEQQRIVEKLDQILPLCDDLKEE